MRARRSSRWQAGDEPGFSLIEVLVAVAIFAVITVGAFGALGATAAGGFLDASPMALTTGRQAKDLTVGGAYLQALHDYLAAQDGSVWTALLATWPPGTTERSYCLRRDGLSCSEAEPVLPALLGGYPVPESTPYQLDWTSVRVRIQRWFWDCGVKRYASDRPVATEDLLVRVQSTLTWRFKGQVRTLASGGQDVDRFLPYRSAISLPPTDECS